MRQIGNISAHRGTEFKHRVIFMELKTNQEGKMRLGHSKVGLVKIPPSKMKTFTKNSLVTSIIIASLLLVLFGVIGVVLHRAAGVFMSTVETSDEEYCEELNHYHLELSKELGHGRFVGNPYQFFVDNGNYYLKSGNIVLAQEDFQRALKVEPYGEEARLGLIKVLEHHCSVDSIHCEELEEQRVFADRMGFR